LSPFGTHLRISVSSGAWPRRSQVQPRERRFDVRVAALAVVEGEFPSEAFGQLWSEVVAGTRDAVRKFKEVICLNLVAADEKVRASRSR
jgi:hypothetical protein